MLLLQESKLVSVRISATCLRLHPNLRETGAAMAAMAAVVAMAMLAMVMPLISKQVQTYLNHLKKEKLRLICLTTMVSMRE